MIFLPSLSCSYNNVEYCSLTCKYAGSFWDFTLLKYHRACLLSLDCQLFLLVSIRWSRLPSSFLLPHHTPVYAFIWSSLISYITTSKHSTTIMLLTPKGSLTVQHAAMSLCFLMDHRMLHKAFMENPSRMLTHSCKKNLAITKTSATAPHMGTFQIVSWLRSDVQSSHVLSA